MFPAGPVVDPRFPARSGWGEARPATALNHGAHAHEGLDFAAPVGSPAFALAAGTVVRSERSAGVEGEWIVLLHSWGVSRYMHLEKRFVAVGQTVIDAQPIGLTGSSGIERSAAHLHFDLAIKRALLPTYERKYGVPKGGFGKVRSYAGHEVVSVPAEPIVPASLADRVLGGAKDRGVAIRSGTWDSVGVGVVAELATKGGLI